MEQATRKQLRKLSDVAKRERVTDTSGSPSETDYSSLLQSLGQRWNEFVQRARREISVEDFDYIRATESRVAAELYLTVRRVEDRLNRLAHHFPMLSWEESHYHRAWILVREIQHGIYPKKIERGTHG